MPISLTYIRSGTRQSATKTDKQKRSTHRARNGKLRPTIARDEDSVEIAKGNCAAGASHRLTARH